MLQGQTLSRAGSDPARAKPHPTEPPPPPLTAGSLLDLTTTLDLITDVMSAPCHVRGRAQHFHTATIQLGESMPYCVVDRIAMCADPAPLVVRRTGSATTLQSPPVTHSRAAQSLAVKGSVPAAPSTAAPHSRMPRPQASVGPDQPGPQAPLLARSAAYGVRPAVAAPVLSSNCPPASQPGPPVLALPRTMVRHDSATCLHYLCSLAEAIR